MNYWPALACSYIVDWVAIDPFYLLLTVDFSDLKIHNTTRHIVCSKPRFDFSHFSGLCVCLLEKINCATEVIVDQLGRKWLQYGRKLGISEAKLEGIEERHPRNLEEKVRGLLKEWRKMRKSEARVDDLIKALRACDLNYTADIVERKLNPPNKA